MFFPFNHSLKWSLASIWSFLIKYGDGLTPWCLVMREPMAFDNIQQVPCHIWFENWQANFKIASSTARELWGIKSLLNIVDNTMRWHLKQPYRLNGSRCGETGFGRSVSGHHQLHSVSLLLEESDGLLLRHALIQRNPINRKNLIILLQSSIPEDKNDHSLTCQSKYP